MGDRSAIEWTDATLNVFRGTVGRWACSRVSPGCDHCYAATLNKRFGGPDYAEPGQPLNDTLRLDEKALGLPWRWRKPRRIFVNSMTDTFHESVPDEWLDRLFLTMALAPHYSFQHTYQVLTKRPRRMRDYLAGGVRERLVERMRSASDQGVNGWADFAPGVARHRIWIDMWAADPTSWPLPNVWLGTSIELDRYAWRAKVLADTPAAVRFVSAEPLLGPLPSLQLCADDCPACHFFDGWPKNAGVNSRAVPPHKPAIHWVITGGESNGPGDRRLTEQFIGIKPDGEGERLGYVWEPKPEAVGWVREIRDRCQQAGVAYFHKQWGGPTPKAGGRLLDGREWSEYPASRVAVPA